MSVPDAGQDKGARHDADGPLFITEEDGRVYADILPLVEGRGFSLAKLALNFANPWLEEEIRAECPWQGVDRHTPRPNLPRPGSTDLGELPGQFRSAVERAIGAAGTVVVMYSGGIDSTAVLVEAAELCRRQGRQLVAVTWGLRDLSGESTGAIAQRVVAGLELECELVVLPPEWRHLPEPVWSPVGPRHDYYTRLYQATVDIAVSREACVILSGEGGDEVLGAWNYLSWPLARGRRWRDLVRYLHGFIAGESVVETTGEVFAALAGMLPHRTSFRLYTTLALGSSLRPLPEPVLTPPYQEYVLDRLRGWLAERAEIFAELHGDWVASALWDVVFPFAHDPYPISAGVPTRSPFLDKAFVQYAFGLPPDERFAAVGPYPYHWYKTLHFRLLPAGARAVLPSSKQDYYGEFQRYVAEVMPEGPLECVRLGLLRPTDLSILGRIHRRLPIVLRNVEHWVRGALRAGTEPVPADR